MATAPSDPRNTPAMRQFYAFKKAHPDCVLLFRIGDFYETFDDDAVLLSKALGLTLTRRAEGVPMAGVPYHQLDNYLRRAVAQGFRVAVCDQLQDPKEAKGIIERGVTRVVTPGTVVDESLLADEAVSTLAAVCFLESGDSSRAAAAVADLSTGSFLVFECAAAELADELIRRAATELLYSDTADGKPPPRVSAVLNAVAAAGGGIAGSARPPWHFRRDEAVEVLLTHYRVRALDGFGLGADDAVVLPAGAIVRYLRATQMPDADASPNSSSASASVRDGRSAPRPATLAHLAPPRLDQRTSRCVIDATTLRSLEVLRTMRAVGGSGSDAGGGGGGGAVAGAGGGSLLGVFSSGVSCRTAMGKRLLRDWLCSPLAELERIERRQAAVALLVEDRRVAGSIGDALLGVQDVVRIGSRLALRRASPRDLVALGGSLARCELVLEAIRDAPALAAQAEALRATSATLGPIAERIGAACVETPPAHLRDGGVIRDGVDAELDEARLLRRDASGWLAEYQARLIQSHELPSLKVGYNRIFGYYIELPAAQARRAPDSFSRKQTLKGAERYITPELREFEEKVTHAEARAMEREAALFNALVDRCAESVAVIARFGESVAELDVLCCFADKAARRGWVRPAMCERPVLYVEQGRHPVLDEMLGSNFVPNDVALGVRPEEGGAPGFAGESPSEGPSAPSLALITGPNMAGKSTFIRQTALIALLAHTGCFVPADRAVIGITDRIFTRVGADDALHSGQSTFMVEMTETARILHHATVRSLVILDEVGRGTSTLDGLSLAWAIAETLAAPMDGPRSPARADSNTCRAGWSPRTLFATHYHEITQLEEQLPGRVANLHVSVREWGDEIVFMHRILPGRTDQSYGIHVAKLAGVPDPTIRRARQILESLAVHHDGAAAVPPIPVNNGVRRHDDQGQLSLFTEYLAHPAVDELKEIKIESLSPIQAFDALRRLKELAGRDENRHT